MFQVHAFQTSEKIYAGARQIVSLHEAGVGLCEAVIALEPIAEVLWQIYRDDEDAGIFANRRFHLRVDPSVLIAVDVGSMEGDWEYMGIRIERPGRFSIQLGCHAEEGGDFIPFVDGNPAIGIEAKDANELAKFLTLTRTLGGELEVDP